MCLSYMISFDVKASNIMHLKVITRSIVALPTWRGLSGVHLVREYKISEAATNVYDRLFQVSVLPL